MIVENIIVSASVVIAFVAVVVVLIKCLPFLYDFRISQESVNFVFLNNFALFKIRFCDIENAMIINPIFPFNANENPFRSMYIGNRMTLKAVLIEKKGL